jgi:transcriptional regulator with XRE-family HTH domain
MTDKNLVAQVAERIVRRRKALGFSATQVADHLGIKKQSYSHIENGRNLPRLETLVALAELFGVTLDWFLAVDEKEAANDTILNVNYWLERIGPDKQAMVAGIVKSVYETDTKTVPSDKS